MLRIFNTIKEITDMVSIVDTGSTDNTEEVIPEWGKKNSFPTTIHHQSFRNFAYNRNYSVRASKETYTDADYFLLSDEKFVREINVGNKFDKILLVDHKYLIE